MKRLITPEELTQFEASDLERQARLAQLTEECLAQRLEDVAATVDRNRTALEAEAHVHDRLRRYTR